MITTCTSNGTPSFPYNTKVNMKTMTLTDKFKKDIQTLRGAANGELFPDVKNPKLFKKVRLIMKMKV